MKLKEINKNTKIIEDLKKFGREQDYFHLDIRITSKCNYNCYYCTDMHDNTKPFYDFNIDNIGDMIINISKYIKKPIHIFLYGGEPTIYPSITQALIKIADYIQKYNNIFENKPILEVQSNLALKEDYFSDLCDELQEYKDFLIISGSYHNTLTNFNTFLGKARIIKSKGLLGMLTFMYNSKN